MYIIYNSFFYDTWTEWLFSDHTIFTSVNFSYIGTEVVYIFYSITEYYGENIKRRFHKFLEVDMSNSTVSSVVAKQFPLARCRVLKRMFDNRKVKARSPLLAAKFFLIVSKKAKCRQVLPGTSI